MMLHRLFHGALLLASTSLLISQPALAQAQESDGRDILERVPNLIRKVGPYGAEMMIVGTPVVERTACRPAYPQSSIKHGETGTVVFRLMIDQAGVATRARLVGTSGFRDLDRAAMLGFLGCRFKPVVEDGLPVESWIPMRYVWEIG